VEGTDYESKDYVAPLENIEARQCQLQERSERRDHQNTSVQAGGVEHLKPYSQRNPTDRPWSLAGNYAHHKVYSVAVVQEMAHERGDSLCVGDELAAHCHRRELIDWVAFRKDTHRCHARKVPI